MTNPQLTRNFLGGIRSLPDADRRRGEQLGQDPADLSNHVLAAMAQAGQAFDVLAEEPDLYSFSDGEPIVAA
jgi:hypothetical protein